MNAQVMLKQLGISGRSDATSDEPPKTWVIKEKIGGAVGGLGDDQENKIVRCRVKPKQMITQQSWS